MPNLRLYERAQLLALPAGAELDELVASVLGWTRVGDYVELKNKRGGIPPGRKSCAVYPIIEYSRDGYGVFEMLVKLREYWPRYEIASLPEGYEITDDWAKEYIDDDDCFSRSDLPHVCALALCLAAWEKERQP